MNLVPKNFSFDDMFDNFPYPKFLNGLKCDVYEKNNMYCIDAETPGFKKEDIKINFDDGYLTISCKKQAQKEEEKKNYIRKERSASEYKREIYIGNVDKNKIKAKYENGLLHIEVAKNKENPNSKEISIE